MLESLIFSLNSTMPLFFLMLLGYLLHRRQFLTDDFVAMANKFVVQRKSLSMQNCRKASIFRPRLDTTPRTGQSCSMRAR